MAIGYIDGVDVPDYDDRVSAAIEKVQPPEDPDAFNPFSGDEYLMGIANRDGEVYRVIGVGMTEGMRMERELADLGLRDVVGERGSVRGLQFLMRLDSDS
ncbi:hypothetical protein [Salinicola sp. RZ23]|uniref:hypothetical protein n=1 Tax=Salinicola sp. RZ23 TaxID=1949087 RepID=UPI000DA23E99|nr:hypothetical protein [Salinicola sp. RZ23]